MAGADNIQVGRTILVVLENNGAIGGRERSPAQGRRGGLISGQGKSGDAKQEERGRQAAHKKRKGAKILPYGAFLPKGMPVFAIVEQSAGAGSTSQNATPSATGQRSGTRNRVVQHAYYTGKLSVGERYLANRFHDGSRKKGAVCTHYQV
ncbi:MAG: hypothetical protein IT388_04345 [Nitrospirales bacterium]|nr:hypothetical protein [Nitrospirales bacterium]